MRRTIFRIILGITVVIAVLLGVMFTVIWLTSGLEDAVQAVGLWLTIMGACSVLGIIAGGLNWLLTSHKTTKRVFVIVGKIAVNLLYVLIGIFVISEYEGWHEFTNILRIVFGIMGFVTCWILINWAMKGSLQEWLKKQGQE